MKIHAIRLIEGQDLKIEIIKFVKDNNIKAGFIISSVGCLSQAVIRMADENITREFKQKFEIVSLTGTLGLDDIHIHISLSDRDGKVIGGHLKEGCTVSYTTELVIGESPDHIFHRVLDDKTGFNELSVETLP